MNDIIPPGPVGPPPDRYPGTMLDMVERLTILEMQNAQIMGEQTEAQKSRSLLHDKLDGIKDQMAADGAALARLNEKLIEMQPVLALHERLRLQFRGAGLLLGFIWSIAVLSLGFLANRIWMWFTGGK